MKKVLLTTTALTLLGGAAVADVTVSADARMGVFSRGAIAPIGSSAEIGTRTTAANVAANTATTKAALAVTAYNAYVAAPDAAKYTTYTTAAGVSATAATAAATAAAALDAIDGTAASTGTESRMRVHFAGSGETDGGLTFGAKMSLRLNNGATTPGFIGHSVYISNGMATLRYGNTAGAIENTSGIWGIPSVGYTGMSFGGVLFQTNTSSSASGAGPNQVALDLSLGSANVTVSGGNGNASEVAVSFSAGSLNLGIGAVASGGTYVTAGTSVGGVNLSTAFHSAATGANSWALGMSTALGGGTVKAYAANKAGTSNYGLGYSYGLGGGAAVSAGFESLGGVQNLEVGMTMSF